MQTEAVFENIADRIESEIGKAQKSIFIAVAWFTNKSIFNALLEKAKEGCFVILLISNHEFNIDTEIDFNELEEYYGAFFKIGDSDTELMHHKFCLIDHQTVITGSYNWTNAAAIHSENIIVIREKAVANQYTFEFFKLLGLANTLETISYHKELLRDNKEMIWFGSDVYVTEADAKEYNIPFSGPGTYLVPLKDWTNPETGTKHKKGVFMLFPA